MVWAVRKSKGNGGLLTSECRGKGAVLEKKSHRHLDTLPKHRHSR